jgi:hypothetical protein
MAVIIFLLFLLICAVIWPEQIGALIALVFIIGLILAGIAFVVSIWGAVAAFLLTL